MSSTNSYTSVEIADGKYEIRIYENGGLEAYRYGEFWQDLTGNKMVFCLAYELNEAREELRNKHVDI
jgi:hypothetical protein